MAKFVGWIVGCYLGMLLLHFLTGATFELPKTSYLGVIILLTGVMSVTALALWAFIWHKGWKNGSF